MERAKMSFLLWVKIMPWKKVCLMVWDSHINLERRKLPAHFFVCYRNTSTREPISERRAANVSWNQVRNNNFSKFAMLNGPNLILMCFNEQRRSFREGRFSRSTFAYLSWRYVKHLYILLWFFMILNLKYYLSHSYKCKLIPFLDSQEES